MVTASSKTLTDAELVYQYFGKLLGNGGREEPVDRLLAEFAEYRRELEKARAPIREAKESSARSESKPLDLEAVIRRGNARLAAEGIAD